MDEEEKKIVEIACYFVSICYAPWFLKSYLSQANDWNESHQNKFYHKAVILKSWTVFYPFKQRYAWHLTQELV